MEFPHQVKTGYVQEKYLFEYNDSSKPPVLGGIEGNLLKTLSKALNFDYTLVPSPDSEWGSSKPDGTWSGVVGMIARGEVDIAVTFLTATEERMKGVDFSIPYLNTQRTFVTNFPAEKSKAFVYVYPFSLKVWLIFLAMLLVLSLLFYVITHRKQRYEIWLLELFANVLHLTYFKRPKGRWLTAFWRIAALVISLSYCSVLPSFFFIPLKDHQVLTFEELIKAVNERGYRVLVYKGSNALQDLRKTGRDDFLRLAQVIEENEWFIYPGQLQRDLYLEDNTAYIITTFDSQLLYGIPPKSLKFISDDTFAGSHIAVAMRKDFCCKKQINSVVRNIVQYGIYDKFIKHEIFRRRMITQSETKEDRRGPVPLSLDHTFGVFVAFGVGQTISLMVLIIEKHTWNRKIK